MAGTGAQGFALLGAAARRAIVGAQVDEHRGRFDPHGSIGPTLARDDHIAADVTEHEDITTTAQPNDRTSSPSQDCTGARGSDTVARFGGDEFVIAAAALESENDAVRIAKAVLTLLEAPILIGDEQVYVRASIGICIAHPDAAQEPRALITEADAAMYRAKNRGRNRYEPSTPRTRCQPRTG